ncbi:MAG TPA: nuclear transport factor 2 family protein [Croceibacterium sp.]|nr:nuclear transport factor 2 family protein [Croceibacterium sp.]
MPASLAPPVPTGSTGLSAHPTPLLLLEDRDPVLAANKRLVFDMWRGVVNAGHVELADRLLAEDYIQHSPVISTGRAAFKRVFAAVERRDEIPEVVSPPLVTILAEGDLVVMALREELPAAGGKGTYANVHFNLFRVRDGRLAEHWHSVQAAPGPQVPSPADGGPQPVTGVEGTGQEALLGSADPALAANKRLVHAAWRAAVEQGLDAMARRYLASGYLEHNANGGALPRAFMARPGDAPLDGPLVAMVAQGDLVVLVQALQLPHPVRPGQTYTTTWFDMFRIENGRIVEHWDAAPMAGAPEPVYGN